MPSIKIIALVASLAASAVAYTESGLYARNDLDFTPDDLEVLFGRDAQPEADYEALDAGLQIVARGLDMEVDDVAFIAARDPSILSSVFSVGKKIVGAVSKHKDEITRVGSAGTRLAEQGMQVKQQQLANKGTQMQMQQGYGQPRRRDLDEEDAELWY